MLPINYSFTNHINIYIYIYIYISREREREFANGPGDWGSIPGWVISNTKKMVLDAASALWGKNQW